MDGRRRTSEERRKFILQWLKESNEPLTGQEIAEKTNVSRQVIVQDISILKAKNEPIIATSQGYIYMNTNQELYTFKRLIACIHSFEQTKEELMIFVDHGVYVRNVIIDHPIYGEITAPLMLKNRRDVYNFINKLKDTNATLLSTLTNGIHLHTIEAETKEQLDEVCYELDKNGFLLSKDE
ncbi:transcriptional regulator [Vulcanibacillus modesticaldus]|uniref:Transcriptional regulator n=1 Tax=Vulcanibacillus modesticaldus TaxID=337097 RepID=A0A1D2YU50_9BACI|nr:transcription repressor NadR [Vulcanibacillus modesticaldus]OEF99219.1 transcriptional regulator [Vulcanibacillus modesticaldus]